METKTKSILAIVSDIAEGYIAVNYLFLKKFNDEDLTQLQEALIKKERQIRAEPFPFNEPLLIRRRNVKLQRIRQALVILKSFIKDRI